MNNLHNIRHVWRCALGALMLAAMITPAFAVLHIEDVHEQTLTDMDTRSGTLIEPTAAQLSAVDAMGAKVAWTEFGTPRSLIRHGGYLATDLNADPVIAARQWLSTNAALFRLNTTDVAALELYHVGELAHSDAKAVKFRQNFNGLAAQAGGIVTVGVVNGSVAIVTSSIVGIPSGSSIDEITLSPTQAITTAAQDAGFDLALGGLSNQATDNAWTTFDLAGHVGKQRARQMAFVTPGGPRPVFEVWLMDNSQGRTRAYMYLVDAGGATQGDILFRQNKVFQLMDHTPSAKEPGANRAPVTTSFDGAFTAPPDAFTCGPLHGAYTPPGPTYSRIVIVANATVATNDIVVNLYYDDPLDFPDAGAQLLTSTDVGFGEVATYEPGGFIADGDYFAEICPLEGSINQNWLPPFTYTGTFTFDDTPVPSIGADPSWNHFPANPPIDLSSTDTRDLGCWLNPSASPACDFTVGNVAARGPWDFDFVAGAPTNTTIGNAAISGEAWLSPLTPAEQYRPTAADRNYDYPWTNVWQTTGCSPTNFTPGVGNDIDAAVTNMFVAHNRVHDFAYYLGFNEINSNFQTENFGNTDASRENDAIIGNVQAGAVDGAYPAYLGRDNANFIPLPDGAPGVTNQYLWQALLGAIYTPCADGNYDTGIVGHEVGHGIQHRMTGGPATGLGGNQGGQMGEGWGDLTGMEYQVAMGFVPTTSESPFAIGVYVLGSPERGIRNYNMSTSPLNYSDMQYDPFGNSSPHANGEIWSATNFRVRQALIDQHDSTDPASNAVKQRQCAEGDFAPSDCPGNRRWIQIMHDGFLLQPSAPSMLDARDAQMAGDLLRLAEDPADWGDHYDALWLAYAQSGMGWNASSAGSNDSNPTADFSLPPDHTLANANIGFVALAQDEGSAPIAAEIFVGHYEARANPVATTDAGGLPATALIAPGTYDFVVRADGYGHLRFSQTFTAGQTGTVTVVVPTNFASSSKGASASGDGTDHGSLIDDTEATNWDYAGQIGEGNEQVVTVNLGSTRSINRVQVSALAHEGGNRFQQLRQFKVLGCQTGILADCTTPAEFSVLYTSGLDAFDGQPIRPLAPNLLVKSFDLGGTFTVSHLQFVAMHNQCTGSTEFTHSNWATGAVFPDDVQDCRSEQGEGVNGLPSRDDVVHAAEFQAFGSEGGVLIPDADLDGIADVDDNCPITPNADQFDFDLDGVGDVCDNCSEEANANQCDTNSDGFGNVCDGDLNNNGVVNFVDLGMLKTAFLSGPADANWNPDADLTCDGVVVNFVDLGIMKSQWLQPPGPSGIAP